MNSKWTIKWVNLLTVCVSAYYTGLPRTGQINWSKLSYEHEIYSALVLVAMNCKF